MITELLKSIEPKINTLNSHPIYARLRNLDELKFFMQRHVFAVFDFMSLAKALQNQYAPSNKYWTPPKNPKMARFINEIILAEESDLLFGKEESPMSHFEIYLKAMDEVNADTIAIKTLLKMMERNDNFLQSNLIPKSCKHFISETFNIINRKKPNEIAAYFCFGREKIIPDLFQSILTKSEIQKEKSPIFNFYLQRHIEIDGDHHGPIALEMIQGICGNDKQMWDETKKAANNAISCRITFWDNILEELNLNQDKDKKTPLNFQRGPSLNL